MRYFYERVENDEGLPIKAIVHSVDGIDLHWHNEMEIIIVLQGSVNIRVGNELYELGENDLILINSNEVHNTSKTKEQNVLLALQLDLGYFSAYYPKCNRIVFDCKSSLYKNKEQERFDIIRHYTAKIVWELNKKEKGYQLIIGSDVNLLAAYLVNNFDYYFVENESIGNKDVNRLQRITSYINENLEKDVSLKEIAEREQLNSYYLSHFIKEKMGMSFQKYLNIVRLDRAVELLLDPDKTITEISFASGFSSTKAFNNKFKDTYDCSPTEYRKRNGSNTSNEDIDKSTSSMGEKSKTYLDVDRSAAFKRLFTYLKPLDNKVDYENEGISGKEVIEVNANKNSRGVAYNPYWKKLTTFGRAAEGLRKGWQSQLKDMQSEIGFEYIRFHGIFSDDMMVVNINEEGNIVYNWSYVDELFDFFKEVNIKPFIELGFMPSEIKKSDETVFWWKANISGPRDIKLWTNLVVEFIKHCINRYGLEEVSTWYFEVWNEPDLEYVFWAGGKEEYFEFYKQTALAIKSISDKLKVGGPSVVYQVLSDNTWFEDFLSYCSDQNVPIDFISLHIYPEYYSIKTDIQDVKGIMEQMKDPKEVLKCLKDTEKVYFGRNHTHDSLVSAKDKINKSKINTLEIHITEWNACSYSRNLVNDTCFVAAFIISNILDCIGKVDSMGYWTFTDSMEELKIGVSEFHGCFGLINKSGLKKPSYYAYYLLSKLGDEIISQGDGYIITRKGENIQILACNYAYFDDLFLNGDTSALTETERYLVYEPKPDKEINISIKEISGNFKITKYKLDRKNGSVFDEWLDMGAPENMTQEELNYLKGKAKPKITIKYLELNGEYKEKLYIPVHGAQLVILEKRF